MRYSSLTLLVACGLAATAVQAQANKITFEGEVTEQTCQVTVNGQTDAQVLLPTVKTTDLNGQASKAGQTPITMLITGCKKPSAGGKKDIKVKFHGFNVDSDGNLGNSANQSAATKVAVQLTKDASGTDAIALDNLQTTTVDAATLADDDETATYVFGARYFSKDGGAGAGAVKASVEYTLSYL